MIDMIQKYEEFRERRKNMDIHERVKEIKLKVLDVIESRVTNDASLEELQHITHALNNIDEDKNFLAKTFAGISSIGFNGGSNKIPEANTAETK